MTKTVLVDNCVDSFSQIMQGVSMEQEIRWGDCTQRGQIVGFQRKPQRGPDEKWLQYQIEGLPTVARIAREGQVAFYTYNEIQIEACLRPGGFPALPLGDLFRDISFQDVDAAIERSRLFQSKNFAEREEVINFCKWLLHPEIESIAETAVIKKRLPEFELNNLRNIQRFRDLCAGFSEKHYPDAFHLWTGEVNKLDYFLTTDNKFIGMIRERKMIGLPCKPVSPEELLDEFSVSDREPFPFKPGKFYMIGEH